MKDLIILRGESGVGKSTIGKLLSKFFKKGVTIEIDDIRNMVNSVEWTNNKEYIDAIESTKSLAFVFLQNKYLPVIIIDTFSFQTTRIIIDNLPTGTTYKIITLIASKIKIKERIMRRNKELVVFDEFDFTQENDICCEVNHFLIDTTDMSADEVFERITKEIF